jgi:hypothetical protein
MGGGREMEEPDKYNPDAPEPTALEDSGLETYHLGRHFLECLHSSHTPPNPAASSRRYHLAKG